MSEIYRKALDLFVKNGYHSTPMAMIAKVAGMSSGNLFYYCSSKENLLYEIHLNHLHKHFVPILLEAERLADPIDRIRTFLGKFTLVTASDPATTVLVEEMRSLSRGHREEIEKVWRRGYELLHEAIEELQRGGKARKGRESFLAFIGASMAFWVVRWFDYSRRANAEELAETVVQTFLSGLLAAPGE